MLSLSLFLFGVFLSCDCIELCAVTIYRLLNVSVIFSAVYLRTGLSMQWIHKAKSDWIHCKKVCMCFWVSLLFGWNQNAMKQWFQCKINCFHLIWRWKNDFSFFLFAMEISNVLFLTVLFFFSTAQQLSTAYSECVKNVCYETRPEFVKHTNWFSFPFSPFWDCELFRVNSFKRVCVANVCVWMCVW